MWIVIDGRRNGWNSEKMEAHVSFIHTSFGGNTEFALAERYHTNLDLSCYRHPVIVVLKVCILYYDVLLFVPRFVHCHVCRTTNWPIQVCCSFVRGEEIFQSAIFQFPCWVYFGWTPSRWRIFKAENTIFSFFCINQPHGRRHLETELQRLLQRLCSALIVSSSTRVTRFAPVLKFKNNWVRVALPSKVDIRVAVNLYNRALSSERVPSVEKLQKQNIENKDFDFCRT